MGQFWPIFAQNSGSIFTDFAPQKTRSSAPGMGNFANKTKRSKIPNIVPEFLRGASKDGRRARVCFAQRARVRGSGGFVSF